MAKHVIQYENNPFYIGLNGLQLLFKRAQSVGIYAAVLVGIGVLIGTTANIVDVANDVNGSKHDGHSDIAKVDTDVDLGMLFAAAGIILVLVLVLTLVTLLLYGVLEYTSARLALGEKVALNDALRATVKKLPGYLWVYVIMYVKIFLWTLLLIIPGMIMAVRYSLTGTVFFAENKRGNAAVKRSAELTKGAWFTTFAGTNLWNLITFGQIGWIITPSANAILYRQLRDTTDRAVKKPNAHWLSWLTFFGPIILFTVFLAFIMFMLLIPLVLWLASR